MTSIRENILSTITAALSADTALGVPVYRSRATAIARGEGICVVVEPALDSPSFDEFPKSNWHLTVNITVVARGDVPDSVADPAVSEIYKKIMSDPTVSGLAMSVEPTSVSWEIVNADASAVVVTNSFSVMYRTSQTDISSS